MNLISEDEPINRGVIFNQFPHLLMFCSGLSQSKSHFRLQVERTLKNDPNLTPDRQFYRKSRDGSLSREDIRKSFNEMVHSELVEKYMALLDSHVNNSKSIGGWCFLDGLVRGAKLSYKSPELQGYLDFILFICDSEKKYICALTANPSNGSRSRLNKLSQHWLCLPENHFDEPTTEKMVQYLIAQVLLWAALFEKFMIFEQAGRVENTADNGTPFSFTFNKYIPTINKEGTVRYSVDILLYSVKSRWGKNKYAKDKISWSLLYKDIANAIAKKKLEPDPESIKKQFLRWRSGKLLLTIKSFKEKIAILYGASDESDSALMIIPFIQLFDRIQREFIKEGVPQEYIVQQFEKYPLYVDLVSSRYKQFLKTKTVSA